MLRLACLLFVLALVAALFGFGWVAGLAFEAARILFFLLLLLAVLLFVLDFLHSAPPSGSF
jgi:uncharacterized membrane protein YtjA (UPF0391 family)